MSNMHTRSPAGLGSAPQYMPWATIVPYLFTLCSEFPTSNCSLLEQSVISLCLHNTWRSNPRKRFQDLNPQSINFHKLWHIQILLLLSSDSILLSEWPLQYVPKKTHTGVRSHTDTISGHHLIVILDGHTRTEGFLSQNCSNFQAVSGVSQGLQQGGLRSWLWIMCDSNALWPQQCLLCGRRQFFTWERDAVYGLSTAVPCQQDWPLPPRLLAAHTASACHFYGSLSIDPTEQADLCFSS